MHERFPALWQHRRRFEIPLRGLPRRACERLIREVLGGPTVAAVEARIIAQAAGNALFLEELIRAAAEGKGEGGPDTVLAMLQARLSRLPPRSRTLLCAASIFGTSFWPGGVAALLARGDTEALAACYPHLLEQELIEAQVGSRLAGEEEYRFRHDLVRDAAYGLLSDEDRALGHELAARYLAAAGELDAFPIAEHFRLGGIRAEAALWYQRAAEQALAANELELCRERAERALLAGAQGRTRGRLYGLQADAAAWLGQDAEARRCAEQAMELLPAGSAEWYLSAGHILVTSGRLRTWDTVERWLATVLSAEPAPEAQAALALCLGRTGYMFMMQGRPADMKRIAEALAARVPELPDSAPVARAQVSHFLSGCAFTRGDYAAGLRHLEQTVADFERAGDVRSACLERSNLAGVYIEGGMPEAAVRLCRDNLVACERARLGNARNLAQLMLGFSLTFFPERRGEAAACLAEATERSAAAQHVRHEGWARSARARLYYLQGRPAEAEVEARAALRLSAGTPTIQTWPLGWLARALVALGRADEGLGYAEQALLSLKTIGGFTMDVSVPQLAQLEALLALGRTAEAREAAANGLRRLQRRAERLSDPVWQARLLAHPENVQLLAYAAAEPGRADEV